ncbi:MAG: hypothetical protein COW55_00100 [Rhodobacteraceae bacterium CG17_big_fil_post_rev_8_21_14_2_50_65_11]|nr:MAG: hypothetical protein COW55_00100 [Rhodobacteraceae bacterium CG17_big_fil_post_rev_8_21_14_2_50_65_11]
MFGESLTIRLAPRDLNALHGLAAEQDLSVDHIIRGLITREIRRAADAKTRQCADERLVARLQRLLAPTMAEAIDWHDLQRRLRAVGFELRPAGGGLTLHRLPTGARLCKSSEIGFAYSRFVKRFGAPMPGHPHKMRHLLNRAHPEETDDDVDLIEEI